MNPRPLRPHQRSVSTLVLALVFASLPSVAASGDQTSQWRLEFLTDLNIPTGTPFESVGSDSHNADDRATQREDSRRRSASERKASGVFGGISAIAFDPESSTLYALSDSSTPTMFSFLLRVNAGQLQLQPRTMVRFANAKGEPLPVGTVDPEGIALSSNGTLYLSSEGYVARNPPVPPAIFEFGIDGRLIGQFDIPSKYLPADGDDAPRGVRVNKGLESLTLSPDATRLYTATEHPLHQDQPGCGLNEPCVVRVLEFALGRDERRVNREYLYELDPLTAPDAFAATTGTQGLPDLLALENGELLAIERGFVSDRNQNGRNRIRIHQLNLDDATDVLAFGDSQSTSPVTPIRKSLVLDLDDIVEQLDPGFRRLDNFEGICFGPTLPDGNQSIILVSDNNFSSRQRTAFLLFRLVSR